MIMALSLLQMQPNFSNFCPKRIKSAIKGFEASDSSPAKITWGDKYKIIQDSRLRECDYGDLNSKPSDEVEPLQEKSTSVPMPNGESYEQVKARIADFLDDLKKDYDGKHIAIVAHKAPQLALDVLLHHMTWEQAFANDWRKTKSWQPGWEYTLN